MNPLTRQQENWNNSIIKVVEQYGKDAPPIAKYAASKTLAERSREVIGDERFLELADRCRSVEPIHDSEFHDRQTALAKLLHDSGASAYIAEPGPNALYFANISTSQWYLSERPFLLVITPVEVDNSMETSASTKIEAKVSILTPLFEASRAKLLNIPTRNEINFIKWEEDANPYHTLLSALDISGNPTHNKVFVDPESRFLVVEGIRQANHHILVEGPPKEILALRERKSSAEMTLLRCANEVTLLALRAVHRKLHIGIRESQAKQYILEALRSAGLQNGRALVLFGENAALPHGGGTNRQLGEEDFALFDIMGSLHGYYSDLTRTVAIPSSKIPSQKLHTWYLVHAAQRAAFTEAREGRNASEVDQAARQLLNLAGVGEYFTHRLGHGIGIQIHEGPYLHGGNDASLARGNVFSNEPGVYIEGSVGIRLEDCFTINNEGVAELLTAGVGGQATSPWIP
ncbi:Creatinase/aminopeptidase [Serendipita vermifera]|nr:Creatinase/aminopeptidase [Serendipita vermifera]